MPFRALVLTTQVDALIPGLPKVEMLHGEIGNDESAEVRLAIHKRGYVIYKWVTDSDTPGTLASMFFVARCEERLVYALMSHLRLGKIGPGDAAYAATRPGMTLSLPDFIAHVAAVQQDLHDLLFNFGKTGHQTTLVFEMLGFSQTDMFDGKLVRTFRNQVLIFSCGNFRRLVLRLIAWPYKLWILLGPFDEETKRTCAQQFIRALLCDLPFFCRRLRVLFPTVDDMMGPVVRAIVMVWLWTLIWSIYRCEWQHSAFKAAAFSEGAGRKEDTVAREHFLRRVLAAHKHQGLFVSQQDKEMHEQQKRAGRKQKPPRQQPFLQTLKLANDGVSPDNTAALTSQVFALLDAADGPSALAIADGQPDAVDNEDEDPPKGSGRGGCPLQEFMRASLHSCKRTAGPDQRKSNGRLTQDAIDNVYKDCREKFKDPEVRRQFQNHYQDIVKKRKSAGDKPLATAVRHQCCCNASHWGAGTGTEPVHTQYLVAFAQDRQKENRPHNFLSSFQLSTFNFQLSTFVLGALGQLAGCVKKLGSLGAVLGPSWASSRASHSHF